jgi:acylphosphatase
MAIDSESQKSLCRSVRVRIEGRVQGVGFRMFVQREASARGLNGFVRNRRDGGVEAVISGSSADIECLLFVCQRGPRGSHVQMLKVFDEVGRVGDGFSISATV